MGGILDIFDSPDLLQNLFGISSANAAPAQAAVPPQGPVPGVGGGAPPDPRSYNFGPDMSFASRAAPIQADIKSGGADSQGGNYTDFSPNPNMPQPPAAPGGTPPISSGPMPLPRPPGAPGAPPVGPVQVAGPSMMPGGAPTAAPPPPADAMNPPGGPPVTNTSGGLLSSLGLNPNTMQVALAGMGRGLSAVGAQRPGTPAGQAFAAGAGGALTGTVATQQQQQQMARQQQNDLFNQKSAAFKDWMTNNLDSARAKYFDAYAAQRAGGGGSNAWQNTSYGKAQALEKMLDNWENQQRLGLKSKWAAQGSTPERIQSDLDNLAKQKEAERTRRSQALGIDPDEHMRGTAPDHPFDFNKLTPQQRLDVPDGAYYKYHDPNDPKADKNGDVVKQRDWISQPPYEGWQPSGGAQGQPQQTQGAPSPYEVMM